jgi:EAL domain-containing protein (putative c-di-GMP-specific phosphodiesterase class I)/CheY-like chemotaxis protein
MKGSVGFRHVGLLTKLTNSEFRLYQYRIIGSEWYASSMGIAQNQPAEDESRILLVDDDDAVLKGMRRVLEKAGHQVVTCSSGDDALELLANQTFDAMISDIQMPGTTGLKLLRSVREYDLDLPVVLMTGAPGVKSAADAVEYGAFRYLIKPVPLEELTSVVGRAVSVGRMARSKRDYVEEFGSGRFRVGDRAGVDAMLDRALGSLWMAYQPIVRATDSSVLAYEALMRVDEPQLPHPGAVLSAAERVDRLQDVGRAVRNSVVVSTQTADPSWLLFVNLHPEDLLDSTLYKVNSPFAALAHRVVLEVTERVSLERITNIHGKVAELRALGFQIALDDLGAGYAGLTSFTLLEPEFVKLDMSLVRDVDSSATKQKIIRSMVRLCKDLGKQIIAEGVESLAERAQLIELGCDLLQGYLFARPGRPFPSVLV